MDQEEVPIPTNSLFSQQTRRRTTVHRNEPATLRTEFNCLRLEHLDGVLRVTIDNPRSDLNLVDEEMHGELGRLFRNLRRETVSRAVLLTGSKRAFCAGGHSEWFEQIRDIHTMEEVRRDAKQLLWDLLDIEIPIVAAINGPAVGLGASIALLCDVIFMAEGATVIDPHVRVGIVAGDGGAAIWPLAVGPARAKQYLLTGDPVSASEAERIGLVNRVVPGDVLQDEAFTFATRLAQGAPLALRHTKIAVNKLLKESLNIVFDYSTAAEVITMASDDFREGVRALRDKSTPEFKGR
jgi:enoyl-CoA hydratase